jgi:GATA-binding protein, other eukaryote
VQSLFGLFDTSSGSQPARSDGGTPPPGALGNRRTSQKSSAGSNGSEDPLSRAGTPANYGSHLTPHGYPTLPPPDGEYLPSPSLPALHLSHPSPGSTTSYQDRQHEHSHPTDLRSENTILKTRVSELEVINDLFRGRVAELESSETAAREGERRAREAENYVRRLLDESSQRESSLKRRLDELEGDGGDSHRSKKMRVSDIVEDTPIDPALSSLTKSESTASS